MSPSCEVFFYGLFMDRALLRERGLEPGRPRRARVDGFALRIGARATLLPCPGRTAQGLVMRLPRASLRSLYAEPGLAHHRPETLTAVLQDGTRVRACCYNLPPGDPLGEPDRGYAERLADLAARLGFGADYVAQIADAAR